MVQSKVKVGNLTKISGEVNIASGNIVKNIRTIYERSLTAAEEADKARSLENKLLADGVGLYLQRLQGQAKNYKKNASPYKGLLEYRLEDAQAFFGRDTAINDLLSVIDRGPLTIFHAESGAGKTSLLQAGIVPRILAHGHLPVTLRPYNKLPSQALKRVFLPYLSQSPMLANAPLRDFLSRVTRVLGPKTSLYVLIDQFEEFFNHVNQKEQKAFVDDLAECLDDTSLNVHWLISLRTEYHGRLGNFQPRIRNVYKNDYLLNQLTRDEANQAITGPAKSLKLKFEKGLPAKIINDLCKEKEEIVPPQLQLVCSALFETLRPGENLIDTKIYEREGGASGILQGHLGRVLQRFPTPLRSAAMQVLEELITSVQQRAVRSREKLIDSLSLRGVDGKTAAITIDQLMENRLLRADESDGGTTYELAHDYLLGEIKPPQEVRNRKEAEEIIEQGLSTWRRYRRYPFSGDTLSVIKRERARLKFEPVSAALILLSMTSRRKINEWTRFFPEDMRNSIAQFLTSLATEDKNKGNRQINRVLWSLREYIPQTNRNTFILKYFLKYRLPIYIISIFILIILLLKGYSLLSFYTTINPENWKQISGYSTACGWAKPEKIPQLSTDAFNPSDIYLYIPEQSTLICASTDFGGSWKSYKLDLPESIKILEITAANRKLFIVTPENIYSGSFSSLSTMELPASATGMSIHSFAVNPQNQGEYYLLIGENQLFGYASSKWEPIPINNIEAISRSIATDGNYLVVLTDNSVWTHLSGQPDWSTIPLSLNADATSITIPPQSSGQFYVVTADMRVFTGVAQKTNELTELRTWPKTSSLSFTQNIIYLGGADDIYCKGKWNIFSPEWRQIITKEYPPCYQP